MLTRVSTPSPRRPRSAIWLLPGCLLLLVPAPAAAQIFTYTDEHGTVHFSESREHRGFEQFKPKPRRPLPKRVRRRSRVVSHDWDPLIRRAGARYRVPPGLIKAVIHVESAFNPSAVSHKGAAGLMQLMPGTARQLGVADPFDPRDNISGGTRYLGSLMGRYPDNLEHALAAYNAGPGTVRRHGGVPPYRETRVYVRRVLDLYERYAVELR